MFRRIAALVLVSVPLSIFAATQGEPLPPPRPLFPMNNWWNVDISSAPVDLNSTSLLSSSLQTGNLAGVGLHPDFGGDSGEDDFPVYGFPYITVEGSQLKKTVEFDIADESDGVDHDNDDTPFPFYPIPDEVITTIGWMEGGAPGNVDQRDDHDRHILIVDKTNNHLYDLYNMFHNGTGWVGGSGAFFNMNTNNRRTEGWTSADAAGLAILPGLIRYDEFISPDEFRHAFRVTVRRTNGHVYPASHTAGSEPGALPMGARLRLKPGKDISGFTPSVQKIFRAFKKYGLIVADNGSNMFVSGTYNVNWDNGVLNPAFSSLKASDFEVIQLGWHPPVTFVLTLPETTGANDVLSATLTAYNQNYTVATGYTGTVQFTSTDGAATLPGNYTFTAGDNGTHTFTGGFILRTVGSQSVAVTDMANAQNTLTRNVTVGPPTPVGVTATGATGTSVNVSWTASAGATQYEIIRASTSSPYATLITIAGTNHLDTTASPNTAYVYRVKAIDGAGRSSSFSAPDAATTRFFTDDPLSVMVTNVKSAHLTELRLAANSLRAAAGLSAASFTDPTLSSSILVKSIHFGELRTALNAARTALGLPATVFTDPTLVAGTTQVRAVHLQELRNIVK
jgi:hypothetical protein